MAIVWMVLYICLLLEVYKIYKSLESSGYVIKASSIKIPNWIITTGIIAVIFIGAWLVSSFNKYPMEWERYEAEQTVEIEKMKQQLMEQGIPEYVLDDLTAEDIEQCAGASVVVVDDEAINANIGMDAKLPKLMSYAFCIDEEISRWKIVHYFVWDGEPSFFGTEAISYSGNNIINAENISGYVIYDEEDATYRAPYYCMDYVDYVEPIMGMVDTELFTGFSFDREGSNYRGYITYELVSKMTINITMDYYHQRLRIIYPAQTAWDYGELKVRTLFFSDKWEIFSHIRNGISIEPLDVNGK